MESERMSARYKESIHKRESERWQTESAKKCRRLYMWGTQSGKFTCVGLGTKRLAPFKFAHSVLVIALSQTGLATLVCRRGLLRVGSRVVIPNLRPRCRWCRLFLIAHLDAPRRGASASWFEWCSRGRCASQRAPSPFVRLRRGLV